MPKLIHSRDGRFLGEFDLQTGTLSIGRTVDCDITLDDETVSGRHALITVRDSAYMEGLLDLLIEDLGSSNGTFVNHKRLSKRHMLKHNETVRIGSHEFTLIDEGTRALETTTIILPENP